MSPHWTATSRAGQAVAPFGRVVRALGGPYPFVANEIVLHVSGDPDTITAVQISLPQGAIAFGERTRGLIEVFLETGISEVPRFGGRTGNGMDSLRLHVRYRPFVALRRSTAPLLILTTSLLLDYAAALASKSDWRRDPLVILGILTVNVSAFFAISKVPGGAATRSVLGTLKVGAWITLVLLTLAFRQAIAGIDPTAWAFDTLLLAVGALTLWAGFYSAFIYPYAWETTARNGWMGVTLVATSLVVLVLSALCATGLREPAALASDIARLLAK